jgi:hypothetical protein
MAFLEIVSLCILAVLALLLRELRAASKGLERIHDDLRIVSTVMQESPEERSQREKEGWEYAGTPNLIRQKHTQSGVPVYKQD